MCNGGQKKASDPLELPDPGAENRRVLCKNSALS